MDNLDKNQAGIALGGVMVIWGIIILIGIGWVLNILDLMRMASEPVFGITVEVVLRCIGIAIAPLGAVMGWFF